MGTVITCQVRRQTVLLDVDTTEQEEGKRNHELWRAQTFETKEPDTLSWIDSSFAPGDVIYDIGANIGQYSLYAAKRLQGQTTILAFEPEALNYAKLNQNIVLNGLVGIVVPYCLAVADRTAIDRFFTQTFAPGAALHTWGKPETQGEKPFAPQNQQGVMAVRLDDLTGQFGLPFPNHIKIDVDGIEEQIVAGGRRTWSDPRLRSVLIEVFMHKDVATHITEAMTGHGFELSNAATVDYRPGIVQNLIFTRPGCRAPGGAKER